jgi:hypothetical protein
VVAVTTVPLGIGAYERQYAGAPEIKLQNRWVEQSPINLREHIMLLSRPGTAQIQTFAANAGFGLKCMRGNYFQGGLFGDALFVVSGTNLYRYNLDGTVIHISGVISGTGHPEVTWQKGIGYERLWIADGLLLQFYGGTTAASGKLTKTGTITSGSDTVQIGGVYYAWNSSVDAGSPAGTAANPWRVNPGTDPMGNLVKAIMDSGVPGTDYSTAISAANTQVIATVDAIPGVVVTVTARTAGTGGNSISTTVVSGTHVSWGATTLQNGGIDALQGVAVPDGVGIRSLTEVSSYVLASVADSQKVFFVQPGAVVIDPLDFFEKEASPDNVLAMRTVGDQALIMGESSAENWYATGDSNAPFAPIEGRVYQRGIIDGSPCIVGDSVMVIGDDGVAYEIGYRPGSTAEWGVHRISNHGIEERIRRQIRREAGLTP